jgi:hypothetical protein
MDSPWCTVKDPQVLSVWRAKLLMSIGESLRQVAFPRSSSHQRFRITVNIILIDGVSDLQAFLSLFA